MALVKRGAVLFGIGVVVTVGSFVLASAQGGGIYIVSFGPMIIGAIYLIQGGLALMNPEKLDQGQPAMPGQPPQYTYPARPQNQPPTGGSWRPPGQ